MILIWYHLMWRMDMKLLTRDTDYAVRALCYMAKKGKGVVSCAELFNELKIPRPFLRKILQMLGKRGIVQSCKGIGGGFKLALPAGKIKLSSLMEIFQGPLRSSECFFKKSICPNRATCPLKKKIDSIGKYVESELGSITIGSLLR
jgi:Rrf2 family protein